MSQSLRANPLLKRVIPVAILLISGIQAAWPAAKEKEEPTATSVFPIGVERGTTAQVEIRGTALDGAYAVVADNAVFVPNVESVEACKGWQALGCFRCKISRLWCACGRHWKAHVRPDAGYPGSKNPTRRALGRCPALSLEQARARQFKARCSWHRYVPPDEEDDGPRP